MLAIDFFRRKEARPALAVVAMLVFGCASLALARAEDNPPPPNPPVPAAKASESVGARIGRLEGQITDMQIMIGTLESLLRGKPAATLPQEAPAPAQAADGSLAPRVEALETQVGAMTHQLERIGQQLTRMEARLSDEAPQSLNPPDEEESPPLFRQGQAPDEPSDTGSVYGDTSKPRWFGPLPGSEDNGGQDRAEAPETLMTALPAPDAQTLYQQAYGEFMQADYPSAEASFRPFLASYPKDALAGSAQYWLGESYYARGEYKNAADAFLKGYKTYKKSDKAPDTLLKLAMSLSALGQKEAACSTFGELDARFPRASEAVRDQAKDERAKAGC